MSVERETPRGPTSEQLRRRALQAAAAEAVLTAEDQILIAEWARKRGIQSAPPRSSDPPTQPPSA